MAIEITWYNDSLRSQVIALFVKEYGVNADEFAALFEQFYFHPFQKNKCLLIVALDGETLAGFQSFFYWPYTFGGKTYNSFQSGNSLVNPSYRGQGLFNKMLAFISQENKTTDIDFLVGFPVEASLRNFIKDKWNNLFNLSWFVKFCNPLGFSARLNPTRFKAGCMRIQQAQDISPVISLSNTSEFYNWREAYMKKGAYFSYSYKNGNDEIIFHLKKNRRKRILNELIIGNVLYSSEAAVQHTSAALKELSYIITRSFSFHFISIAINERCKLPLRAAVEDAGFKRTAKSIYFIVKPFKKNGFVEQPENWLLGRSDIDTW